MTIPTSSDNAKRPRTPLAGPYGHPFHPILVSVPIGAWVASLVFDIASRVSDDDAEMFAEGAFWLIGIGIAGALVAAIFGLMDLLTIPRGTAAFRTGLLHMGLNLAVVVIFIVNCLVREADGYESVKPLHLTLTIVALALLGASGWLGGKLAYRYGVRVADENTQAEGFR
ncbi:DUF2231 domain-containing protein [Aeromicrobium sp.]|uniref:DUF2231 domain-containing protein n=1 Tax=Aeromicrobium sp. TaxID=1871063 RepID=UPI002FC860BC